MTPLAKEAVAAFLMTSFLLGLITIALSILVGCSSDPLSKRHTSSPDTYIQGATSINDQIDQKVIILEHSR